MKKITLKALSKSARKTGGKSVAVNIATVLQASIAEQHQNPDKFKKKIEKESTKLAKKISKKFKFSREQLLEMNHEIEVNGIAAPLPAAASNPPIAKQKRSSNTVTKKDTSSVPEINE